MFDEFMFLTCSALTCVLPYRYNPLMNLYDVTYDSWQVCGWILLQTKEVYCHVFGFSTFESNVVLNRHLKLLLISNNLEKGIYLQLQDRSGVSVCF